MMKTAVKTLWLSASLAAMTASAQLSTNPDKFLGNITTRGQISPSGLVFVNYWNQITGENESKWQSIEGSRRGSFNFTSSKKLEKYAHDNGFPFKFHCLVWGSQYPTWMDKLSTADQYDAIVEWLDAVQKNHPDPDMIDVVNEAIAGHAPAPYKEALGGDGVTGYDWIINAFKMAHERFPNAILIYNDYNTFQWNTDQFITLVQTLRDAGAPIDAYGCQSHDLTDCSVEKFKAAMDKIQDALKMPMYSSEYDIGTADDALQLQRYKEQIPYMWEKDYCAGITLWGWIYGSTWTTNGNSGIIKNGKERPAMTWLREYMASDEAKQAKSPFPGMKKEASVYIRPRYHKCKLHTENVIYIDATMRTKTIDHIDFYINDELTATLTEAPYEVRYTPEKVTSLALKAVVTTTDGTTYERLGGFKVTRGSSTAIDDAIDDSRSDNTWWTLGGQRLNAAPTLPGVYIHNGKKRIIK